MTRPKPRRPPALTPRAAPAWALDGTAACGASEARGWTIVAAALIALFVAGVVAMIAGPHKIGDYFTESDFYGAYADGARLVQHGKLVPSRYTVVGPGYEVTLALVGLVIRNLFLAAELLSAASAAAVAALWFVMLRRRVDARVGAATVLFLVTNVVLFRYAYSATTDVFAIALQSAALFALLGARSEPTAGPSLRRVATAGLLAALAFLTRYNALALLPAGLIAIACGGVGATRRARASLAFTLAFAAPVVPWILFSLAHGGTLGTQLHHNIAYEVFARSKGIVWDDYQKSMQSQFPNLGAVIARDPGAVAARMLANVGEHLRDDGAKLLGTPVAWLAALGVAFTLWSGWLAALWPLLVTGALFFVTLVPVFYSERYSLAVLPAYALLAGVTFASPRLALAVGRGRRVWLKALAAPAALALVLPAAAAQLGHTLEQLPVEVLDAGRALHALRTPGDQVISRKAHVAYYGDCRPLGFPFADSLSQLARYARESHARWLYYSWPEAETRPKFYYLLDTSAVVPGLTARFSSPTRPAVLYEIGPGFGATPAWRQDDTLYAFHMLRGRTSVDRTDPKLFGQLGLAAWWLGRLTEAREALEHATALDPNRHDDFVTLGQVEVEARNYDSARAAYGRALELQPNDGDARLGYGLAAFLGGRDREAADAWRPVIPITVDPRVLRAMAQLYDSLGDAAAATQARARLAAVARR